MALRLVEVLAPSACEEQLIEHLREITPVGLWRYRLSDEHQGIRILVRAERAEALLDILESRCAAVPGLRIVLLAAEATIPRLDEPQAGAAAPPPPASRGHAARISRQELQDDLDEGSRITRIYLATVALSAIVAAVGLLRDSVAVVIGAMVIAPMLTPNMALALATTLGDPRRIRRALGTSGAGALLALALSLTLGLTLSFEPAGREILERTRVSLSDVVLALASGCAGALAFTTAVPAGLIGVMVAVALLPPLVVFGLLLGAGRWSLAAGALLLLLTNVICVNLAAILTFRVQGIRPRTFWEAGQAQRATRIALGLWLLLLAGLVGVILLSRGRA